METAVALLRDRPLLLRFPMHSRPRVGHRQCTGSGDCLSSPGGTTRDVGGNASRPPRSAGVQSLPRLRDRLIQGVVQAPVPAAAVHQVGAELRERVSRGLDHLDEPMGLGDLGLVQVLGLGVGPRRLVALELLVGEFSAGRAPHPPPRCS
jgi:hypothetical protein